MTRYTAQHWGIYEVEREADGKPVMVGMRSDPDPSPIGQFDGPPDVAVEFRTGDVREEDVVTSTRSILASSTAVSSLRW